MKPWRQKPKKLWYLWWAFITGGCFPKNMGNPQIIHFNRVFHEINHPFWGFSPYFWKHLGGGCFQWRMDPCDGIGIFAYMKTIKINEIHVGKYTVRPMDPMGLFCWGRKGVKFWGGEFWLGKFLVRFWLMGVCWWVCCWVACFWMQGRSIIFMLRAAFFGGGERGTKPWYILDMSEHDWTGKLHGSPRSWVKLTFWTTISWNKHMTPRHKNRF